MLSGEEHIPRGVIVTANNEDEAVEALKSEQPMMWQNNTFDSVGEIDVKGWNRKRKPQVVFE